MLQRHGLVLLAALLAPIPLHAQFGERVDVTVMNLEVEVRDREGNPVHGLQASDFQLREGRRVREITNFTEYASGSGAALEGRAAADVASSAPSRPPLHLVIFVDQRNWPLIDHERLGKSLLEMVGQTLRPGDRVRIVGWQRRLYDIVGWSDDLGVVSGGIARAFGMSNISGMSHQNEVDADSLQFERDFAAEAEITDSAVGGAGAYSVTEAVAEAQRWTATKLRWSQLTTIAGGMAALDGRRMMILVTTRLGRAMGARAVRGDDPSAVLRDRFTRAATAAGVSVSVLYPEPQWNGMSAEHAEVIVANPEVSIRDLGPLEEVTDRTGGTLVWGAGLIEKGLPRIAEGLTNFYSIGYRSDLEEGERRDVRVTIPGRDDLRVHARRAVARLSDEERLEAIVIAHAIKPEPSQLPLSLEIAPAPARLGRRAVKIAVRFMLDDLTFDVGEKEAVTGFFVAALAVDSRTGESGQVVIDRHEIRLPIDRYEALEEGQHLTWDAEVRYSPQSDTIAIGIMDTVSEMTGLIRVPLQNAD